MEKNSLDDLFEFAEETESVYDKKKVLLIDGHNLAYRTVFSAVNQMPGDNEKFLFWKHLMVKSLFALVKKFEATSVVLAFDDYRSFGKKWRKEIYPDYKFKRKDARDKSIVNFEKFFKVFNTFIDELQETFENMYVMMVEGCEADDIIAVLSKEVYTDREVVIISSDGDMTQLTQYSNVSQFDPIKQKMLKPLNPIRDLEIKILMGDKSDNIPGIKPKCGKVTAEKIIVNGTLEDLLKDPIIKENYLRNLKLINLNYIPEDIKKDVKNSHENYPVKSINKNTIIEFFVGNNMLKLMDDWQNDSKYIKALE